MINIKDPKISTFTFFLGLYFSIVILGVVNFFSLGSFLKYSAVVPIIAVLPKIKNSRLKSYWLPVVIYYLFAIISILWTVNYEQTFTTVFAFSSFLVLMFAISSQQYNEREISYLKKCLLWSSRFSLIATWIFASFSGGRLLIHEETIREDPNYLCAYFYFGIALCLEGISRAKKINVKIFYLTELLIYLYTIFCTGSRGGLLGGIAIAFVFFLKTTSFKSFSLLFKRILFLILLAFIISFVVNLVDPVVMDRYSSETISESDGSGRYEIWADAIDAFLSYDYLHSLIGKGMGASLEIARIYRFSRVNVMHNVLLENLVGLGLIGVFFYIWRLLIFYKQSKVDVFSFSVFIGMVTLSLSTSIIYLKPTWNILLFIVCLSLSNYNYHRK